MYFNDIHILYYVVIGFIGLVVGKIVAWCNIRLPEKKKIISIDFFEGLFRELHFYDSCCYIVHITFI